MNTPTPFPPLASPSLGVAYAPRATTPRATTAAPARSPVWEAVKWPLRKALLGAYLGARAAWRRPLLTLAVGVALLALLGAGLTIQWMTAPPAVTIDQPALPALPASVTAYLRGQRAFNAAEMWGSLDSAARATGKAGKGSEASLQSALDQERAQGLQITGYVYSGGYQPGDSPAHYTIEVDYAQGGVTGSHTWYFTVDSAGLISGISSL